ncbi:MAG: hypothetical protein J6X33_04815 [Clostridiales bacterium]|nr:hypothetical protein [Clostridiales bacterium]
MKDKAYKLCCSKCHKQIGTLLTQGSGGADNLVLPCYLEGIEYESSVIQSIVREGRSLEMVCFRCKKI